jgi:hypothetical protein
MIVSTERKDSLNQSRKNGKCYKQKISITPAHFQLSDSNKDSRCYSLMVTESIQHCSFSLCRTFHFRIKNIVRYKLTLGEETRTLLKTKSFLMSHRLQDEHPNKNTKFLLVLLDPSISFSCMSSRFVGKVPHSNTSLKTLQQNFASTHCTNICSALSSWPQSLHSVGSRRFFFASCLVDYTV